MNHYSACYSSPIGMIKITADDTKITELTFVDNDSGLCEYQTPVIKECIKQLDEYFAGKRKVFTLPLLIEGTAFQKNVWSKLSKIPYGKTLSYADIASKINQPKACRAVGMANNKNKIAIILPCHRVIGRDHSLTGYAGGLWRKEWLLQHEQQGSNKA
ncbi:MAG: methylated-DNA--[protein]-cysteine S-methyltransferase [Deltaproteobacteria bacterium]|nr:methylated-DNA--[protein]-cysteine S-methyltransferase [Deltaproteobacteria bacterium]